MLRWHVLTGKYVKIFTADGSDFQQWNAGQYLVLHDGWVIRENSAGVPEHAWKKEFFGDEIQILDV